MLEKLAAARETREMRFRAGVPGPRRPLGTASRLGVSRVSRNLASCAEKAECSGEVMGLSSHLFRHRARVSRILRGGVSARERKPNNADD